MLRIQNLLPVALVALAMSLAACSNSDKANREGTSAQKQAADNTAVNARDRNDATVTPTDQGGSEADVALTQTIRQAIMADESFSVNAKNIKIITVAGVVTLRGPVENAAEKDRIAALVQSIAGISRVDNQLEIAGAASY
jgi:osmotically-inducible protein OsmY